MQEEIKETIYFGISMLLLAIVVIFIANGLQLRDEYADVRNEQTNRQAYAKVLDEFDNYNGYSEWKYGTYDGLMCSSCLTGVEVVNAVKTYMCDAGVAVYVSQQGIGGENIYAYNKSSTLDLTADYLQTQIPAESKYHPILYFGNRSENAMVNALNSGSLEEYNSTKNITGIIFIRVA